MADRASVRSIEALRSFRAAVIKFTDEARASVIETETGLSRTLLWLRQDQLPLWKKEIQRRTEDVTQARVRLIAKKETAISENAQCVEEEIALRLATHRLEEAKEREAATKLWIRRLEREVEQFAGKVERVNGFVDADLPNGVARIAAMIEALDAYVSVRTEGETPGITSNAARIAAASRGQTSELEKVVDALRARVPTSIEPTIERLDEPVLIEDGTPLNADDTDEDRWFALAVRSSDGDRYTLIGIANPSLPPVNAARYLDREDVGARLAPHEHLASLPEEWLAIVGRNGIELLVDGHDRPVDPGALQEDDA